MAFDPLTWALGFGLNKATSWALGRLGASDVSDAMQRALTRWARDLPSDASVHPAAIFPSLVGDDDLTSRPALALVRQELRAMRVPSIDAWSGALVEQWHDRRSRLGDQAADFFRIEPERATALLGELALAMHHVCVGDDTLFKETVIARLSALANAGAQIAGDAMPHPLPESTSMATLARTVEKATGSRVYLALLNHDTGTVTIWANWLGTMGQELRRTLATGARLASRIDGVKRVVLGVADLDDLPNSDGSGAVGLLKIRFQEKDLAALARDAPLPLDFWDGIVAAIVADPNTPFESWNEMPLRDFEDKA